MMSIASPIAGTIASPIAGTIPWPIPWEGTFTALVTPFHEADKSIDWAAFERLIETQLGAGISGLVPCGTTGESPTLDRNEHLEVVRRTATLAKGQAIVLAGTGSNSTREAIALSQGAEQAGADAIMLVTPYYSKPTQEGLLEHYVSVAEAVSCPVVVYNVPHRTGVDILPETLARICERASNVVALKDASGNVLRAQELARTLGDRLTIFAGDDALALPSIAVGSRGVISVTSNVYPAEVARATRLALDGNMAEARRAHRRLFPVHEAMFFEANPAPVKAALAYKGIATEAVRSPLVACSSACRQRMLDVLRAFEASA